MEKLKKGLMKVVGVTLLMVLVTALYDYLVHGDAGMQSMWDLVAKSFLVAVVLVLVLGLTRARSVR